MFHRGRPVREFLGAWHAACEAAGLAGKHFHHLRRTAARDMIAAGVPESAAMAVTGHKSRSMFARYNIVTTREVEAALLARMAHRGARHGQKADSRRVKGLI